MIRSELKKNVLDELSSHPYLALEDFNLTEFSNKEKEPCLSVKYRPDETFFFNFHIPKGKTKAADESYGRYRFNCSMSPGRESIEESDSLEGRQGLLNELRDWVKRLYEDIVSAPVIRRFEAQSSAIEELRERFNSLPDEPLTSEDIKQFRQELDQIKADLTSQLKHMTSDKQELTHRIDELGRDIQFLKQTLESMTKRQWGEVFYVRVLKWTKRFYLSLRPLAAGTRLFKGFLPDSVADTLDKIADTADGLANVAEKIPNLDEQANE
jgi:hypothetical protein